MNNKALEALILVDIYYGISESNIGNGCEHGFKPASDCPNYNCEKKIAVMAYETIKAALQSPVAGDVEALKQDFLDGCDTEDYPFKGEEYDIKLIGWVIDRLASRNVLQPPPPDTWQPIESAPRDGTIIQLINGNCIATGQWMRGMWSTHYGEFIYPKGWKPLPNLTIAPPQPVKGDADHD